jgi:hypothetical protein
MPHFSSSFQGLKVKVPSLLIRYFHTSTPAFFDETKENVIQKKAETGFLRIFTQVYFK